MGGGLSVVVVGATGAVGREMVALLEERAFPVERLRLVASPRSQGLALPFGGGRIPVEPLAPGVFRGADLALFSAGASVAREALPMAREAGCLVVDNSSALRMDPGVPLVVPEVNPEAASAHAGVVASPNCSTILLCMVLAPLARAFGLERVVVSTYQAASGAGAGAMAELLESTRAALEGRSLEPAALPQSIAFNLFPQVDAFEASGYTREEDKMERETRRILDLPDLAVEATCVRVPVLRCHSEAVTLELNRAADPVSAARVLARAPGLRVHEPLDTSYPMPADYSGKDEVGVGRIRSSRAFPNGLALWLVGDQLRKGAALNAIQVAESLLLGKSVP